MTWLRRISFIYLAIPVFFFLFGWLNIVSALLVAVVLAFALRAVWELTIVGAFSFKQTDVLFAAFILLFWLFLSGVGGYAFQNWDHHSRNALFHDLIDHSWPVVYSLPAETAAQFSISPNFILSYYFGFWLPSALVGKLLGWDAANFFLFLWSYLGLFLALVFTALKTRLTLTKTALLLIFFSGMDILGSLLFQNLPLYDYPKPFPPIQHLEWWAGTFGFLQYSSFTTDLFWTYNQFIPALLVLSLFITAPNTRAHILLTGLCLFFAPLPALGLALYVSTGLVIDLLLKLKENRRALTGFIFTFENFTGILLGGISLLFFSTNLAGEERSLGLPAPLLLFVIFTLFEWFVIWMILLSANKQNWMWFLTGAILLLAPFVNFGGSWDFMMRMTIPSFYILMTGCGVYLSAAPSLRAKLPLLVLLLIGGVTAFYEMNRSLARFIIYHNLPVPAVLSYEPYFENPPAFDLRFVPELNHPTTLVADDWISISRPNDEGWITKAGELFPDVYSFVWKKNLLK